MQIFKPHEGLQGFQHSDWFSLNHPSSLKSRGRWGRMYCFALSWESSEKKIKVYFSGYKFFLWEFLNRLDCCLFWSDRWLKNSNYFFHLDGVFRWTVTAIHSLVWRMPGSFVFRYRYSLLVLQSSTLMIILWEDFLPITLSSSRYEHSISLV